MQRYWSMYIYEYIVYCRIHFRDLSYYFGVGLSWSAVNVSRRVHSAASVHMNISWAQPWSPTYRWQTLYLIRRSLNLVTSPAVAFFCFFLYDEMCGPISVRKWTKEMTKGIIFSVFTWMMLKIYSSLNTVFPKQFWGIENKCDIFMLQIFFSLKQVCRLS